jgi:acylphosphatase
MTAAARKFLISGRVQGVGYRYFAARAADRWNLSGWVRNLPDGRVEAYATGSQEDLAAFEDRLKSGPAGADVREVRVEEAPADARIEGFHIR